MNRFVAAVLLIFFIAFCFGADSNDGNALNDCSNSNDGQEKKVILGWAACRSGRYVMTACQADDGSRVEIGLTVRQRNFVYECSQNAADSSSLVLRPIACLRQKNKPANAVVVEPGQRIRDPPFVYECTRINSADPNAKSMALKAVACSTSTSDIPDGGSVTLGQFTYNCTRESGSLTNTVREVFLQAKGCLHKGKEYPLNTQAIIGDFAYKCRSTVGWPTALEFAVVGCAYEGHRYDENEKFYTTRKGDLDGRFIMQCRHVNGTWATQPAGCIEEADPPSEHAIGDTWIDNGGPGDKRLKYVMVCRGDVTSVAQVSIQCVYQPNANDPASAVTINGGCMKKFSKPNALVKCTKGAGPNQGVSTEVLNRLSLNKVEKDALAAGFTYC